MPRSAVLLFPVAAALALWCPADACCTAFPRESFVQIASQEMAIVWDATGKIEHFIRRAAFQTRDSNFGFLVPTPSIPELAEASDDLFVRLGRAIEPERITKNVLSVESILLGATLNKASQYAGLRGEAAAVRVLHEQRVAGYDAVVLEADDPVALSNWLKERGYESRPALVDWLRPYVEAKWKITAFKLALMEDGKPRPDEGARYAVRMSFRTERPVFPFRTPADQSAGGPGNHLLRIFFVGADRVKGSLGEGLWEARIPYARRRTDLAALLGDAVPQGAAASEGWLTVFEDGAWPRAAKGDLYFEADRGGEIIPPPVILKRKVPIPMELLLGVPVLGLWLWRRRR